MTSRLSLPEVTLRRRRLWMALSSFVWLVPSLFCFRRTHELEWGAILLPLGLFAAVAHTRLAQRWQLVRRGRLDVDGSGIWFQGVRHRAASSFASGISKGEGSVLLHGKYGPLGDIEIIVPDDDSAANAILLTLNLAADARKTP